MTLSNGHHDSDQTFRELTDLKLPTMLNSQKLSHGLKFEVADEVNEY